MKILKAIIIFALVAAMTGCTGTGNSRNERDESARAEREERYDDEGREGRAFGRRAEKIDSPEDVVERFVNAMSDADVKTAVECLHPSFAKILGYISIEAYGVEADIDAVMEIIPLFKDLMVDYGNMDDAVIEITNMEREDIDSDRVKITTELYIKGDTQEESGIVVFTLRKKDNEWYIFNAE